jgi:hypothetical protein
MTAGSAAATVRYSYDTRDRMTTENTTSYAYDADGNVTSKSGEAAYTWDYENRLAGVAMTSGATVSHQYEADGNRVQMTVTPSGASASATNMLVDTAGCAEWEPAIILEGEPTKAETIRGGIGINKVKGLHGVSVRASPRGFDESEASCDAVLASGLGLIPTPTLRAPDHITLTLPKPVTEGVALEFNTLFGRSP